MTWNFTFLLRLFGQKLKFFEKKSDFFVKKSIFQKSVKTPKMAVFTLF